MYTNRKTDRHIDRKCSAMDTKGLIFLCVCVLFQWKTHCNDNQFQIDITTKGLLSNDNKCYGIIKWHFQWAPNTWRCTLICFWRAFRNRIVHGTRFIDVVLFCMQNISIVHRHILWIFTGFDFDFHNQLAHVIHHHTSGCVCVCTFV